MILYSGLVNTCRKKNVTAVNLKRKIEFAVQVYCINSCTPLFSDSSERYK